MFSVRRGLPIQELAFLGRWRSSVVLTYAEEVLQEKPMALPVKLDANVVDKLVDHVAKVEQEQAEPGPSIPEEQTMSLEKAFDKPRNLWVVNQRQRLEEQASTSGNQGILAAADQGVDDFLWMGLCSALLGVLLLVECTGGQAEVPQMRSQTKGRNQGQRGDGSAPTS